MNAHVDRLIYTIGHSNRSFESFLALLREHEIDVVADVRSSPYSRYAVHFSAEPIKAALENAGVKYVIWASRSVECPKTGRFMMTKVTSDTT
jgi:uncharacterized protein (DUF488 family)